jgi:hypothetical protein
VIDWNVVFLGVIAVAVTVMACVQVGVIVFGARLVRRVDRIAAQIDGEIKPLLTNLNRVGEDAARAAQLAAAQVERVDQLFADVAMRVEDTAASLQSAIIAPAREGFAVLSGVRAAFAALREMRSASAPCAFRTSRRRRGAVHRIARQRERISLPSLSIPSRSRPAPGWLIHDRRWTSASSTSGGPASFETSRARASMFASPAASRS